MLKVSNKEEYVEDRCGDAVLVDGVFKLHGPRDAVSF